MRLFKPPVGHSGIASTVDIVATLPGEDGTSPATSSIGALLAAGYGCRAFATAAAKVLAGTAIEGSVAVFDDDDYYMGGVIAETLRRRGHDVTLVTPSPLVSAWTVNTLEQEKIQRQILEAVWDVDFDGDPNIVEVYVRHLRNKIDRPFGREAIRTLRGAGYRLTSDGG